MATKASIIENHFYILMTFTFCNYDKLLRNKVATLLFEHLCILNNHGLCYIKHFNRHMRLLIF
jgi:hypothetical protein